MYAICNLSIVPLRAEPTDRSEMLSQVLFGETMKITDVKGAWSKVILQNDSYEGWIDSKQINSIEPECFSAIQNRNQLLNGDLIEHLTNDAHVLTTIPIGAELTFLSVPEVNKDNYIFEGKVITGQQPKENLINTAFMFLNAPYLWGGKTPFGIDCSGFSQMVYKLNGYQIPRDAYQQAGLGENLSFIEESEPGDLAFFDNDEGKIIHVGIMMKDNYIIHAHGKVRIDRIDHLGILNVDTGRHTHKLRVIKRIVE